MVNPNTLQCGMIRGFRGVPLAMHYNNTMATIMFRKFFAQLNCLKFNEKEKYTTNTYKAALVYPNKGPVTNLNENSFLILTSDDNMKCHYQVVILCNADCKWVAAQFRDLLQACFKPFIKVPCLEYVFESGMGSNF